MPGHPDADASGYVAFPSMNPAEDMVDLLNSSRSYQAQCRGDLLGQRHDQPLDRHYEVTGCPCPFFPSSISIPAIAAPALAAARSKSRRWRGVSVGVRRCGVESGKLSEQRASERRPLSERRRRGAASRRHCDAAGRAVLPAVHAGAQQDHGGVSASDADAGLKPAEGSSSKINEPDCATLPAAHDRRSGSGWPRPRLAVIGGILALSHWNQERDFKPLFTGLAAEDAGPLLAKLREGGGRVPAGGQRDHRPGSFGACGRSCASRWRRRDCRSRGRIGFELFDKANFGASEFAEQVNYHRAIEGELERSVMSIREVEQARVHITLAKDSLYTESRQPAKASVLVKLRHAAALSPQNVAAICQLTASAVPGLSPDQVSLVDTSGNLLNRPRPSAAADGSAASEAAPRLPQERRARPAEQDRRDARAAAGRGSFSRRGFRGCRSHQRRAERGDLRSEQIGDGDLATDRGRAGAAVSVRRSGHARRICRGPRRKPSTGSSNYARQTENISYQTSRVVKHTRLPQGAVKRLSLSVLVDHTLRWEGDASASSSRPRPKS